MLPEYASAKTYELISTDEKSVANKHCNDIVTKFAVGIIEIQETIPTFYWLPKLHKRPYKARFIANFIGYQNFINDLTKLVSSQHLAHVQLRVCLDY